MQCCLVFTAAVQLLNLFLLAKTDEVFIKTPTSVNANVGSMINFTCVARCEQISWEVDEISASRPQVIRRHITYNTNIEGRTAQSTLRVLASAENNNTSIICKARVSSRSDYVYSEAVVLRVQGRLGAPIRLQADGSRQSIHIHWSDPFTLDITGTEPDILNYTLYINNLNTNLKLSVNATDSNFTFETGDPDPCHVYLFQVSAWSMLGEGKRSVAVEASFLGVPHSIHYRQLSAVVTFLPSGVPNVQLNIQRSTDTCKGKQPNYFTVLLQGAYDTRQQVIVQEILTSTQQKNHTNLALPRTLLPNDIYTVLVVPGNAAGNSTLNTGSITFSTFDTQAAYVIVTDSGDICATCYFAEGTNARGCMVSLSTPLSEALMNFTAFRNTLLDTSAEFCDTISENRVPTEDRLYYTCKVYDVENDAEIGDRPAYSLEKIPVISPQNTTVTCTYTVLDAMCAEQKNTSKNTSTGGLKVSRIALYGGVAGCGVTLLAMFTAILCCWKWQKFKLHKECHSQPGRDVMSMEPNPAYEGITVSQQSN